MAKNEQAVVLRANLDLESPDFHLRKNALTVSGTPDYAVWLDAGSALSGAEGAVHWWVGDWLNYGEKAYGEKYSEALEITGFAEKTLRNDACVAKAFEMSRRRDILSWTHHQMVAGCDNQKQGLWLDLAEAENLSCAQLRQRIRHAGRPKPEPQPGGKVRLIVCRAEKTPLGDELVDLIITSPPYNLGQQNWAMGGDGREPRKEGIGYNDAMGEREYQKWQVDVLEEMWRVAKPGASMFYNHKVRSRAGEIIHPMDWLHDPPDRPNDFPQPWVVRQEIIWDRGSTHNHCPSLFWPHDERIYWLTKGKPTLPEAPIQMPTIWPLPGPIPNTWHPAPFPDELPERCIHALGRPGIVVLDPFAGSCATIRVAVKYGYEAIGIDVSQEYLERSRETNGWTCDLET